MTYKNTKIKTKTSKRNREKTQKEAARTGGFSQNTLTRYFITSSLGTLPARLKRIYRSSHRISDQKARSLHQNCHRTSLLP